MLMTYRSVFFRVRTRFDSYGDASGKREKHYSTSSGVRSGRVLAQVFTGCTSRCARSSVRPEWTDDVRHMGHRRCDVQLRRRPHVPHRRSPGRHEHCRSVDVHHRDRHLVDLRQLYLRKVPALPRHAVPSPAAVDRWHQQQELRHARDERAIHAGVVLLSSSKLALLA